MYMTNQRTSDNHFARHFLIKSKLLPRMLICTYPTLSEFNWVLLSWQPNTFPLLLLVGSSKYSLWSSPTVAWSMLKSMEVKELPTRISQSKLSSGTLTNEPQLTAVGCPAWTFTWCGLSGSVLKKLALWTARQRKGYWSVCGWFGSKLNYDQLWQIKSIGFWYTDHMLQYTDCN